MTETTPGTPSTAVDPDDPSTQRRAIAASTPSRLVGLCAVVVLLIILVFASVVIGARNIAFGDVVAALGENSGEGDDYVIWSMRIPRTLTGIVVGIALGAAGALMQALTRNPLADPGILGVNAGAAFAVALGVATFGVTTMDGQVWFAMAGALTVTVLVYVVGSAGRGAANPVQLTLAGVAIGAVLSGLVNAMVLMNPRTFDSMRHWSAGTIVGRDVDTVARILPFIGVGLVLAMLIAPALNSIALGDDVARAFGVNIVRTRVVVVVAVTVLAGGATAVAGPIAFVGLMVPHLARWFTGPDQRWILAYSLVFGASLVLGADIIGRIVIRPGEMPVGIVIAFVGAPVLIALIRRRRAAAL